MARIEFAPEVFDDFDRILEHLVEFEVPDTHSRTREILAALGLLTHSPNIGRKVKGGKRELVIGQGAHGYVALYRFVSAADTAFILAIRAQREANYRDMDS